MSVLVVGGIVFIGVPVLGAGADPFLVSSVTGVVLVSVVVVAVVAVVVDFAVVFVNVVSSSLPDKVDVVIVDPVETVLLSAKV